MACTNPWPNGYDRSSHTLDTWNILYSSPLFSVVPWSSRIDVYRGIARVKFSDFQDFYLNLQDFDASDWADLLNLDMIQDKMGQLLTEAFTKVTSDGWRLISETIPPIQNYTINDLIRCVTEDVNIQSEYHRETIRGLIQQLQFYNGFALFSGEGMGENGDSTGSNPVYNFFGQMLMPAVLLTKVLGMDADHLMNNVLSEAVTKELSTNGDTKKIKKKELEISH